MRQVVVAVLIVFVSVLAAASGGAAQNDLGSLRIRYVYPDGRPVTDAWICLQGYGATETVTGDFPFAFGDIAANVGPDHTFELQAGDYAFYNACQGDDAGDIASIWSNGGPARWSREYRQHQGGSTDLVYFSVDDPVTVLPGETTVATVTTGRAYIRGSLTGALATGDRCSVTAVGRPFGGFVESAAHGVTTFDGADYELLLPPGTYRLSSSCRSASAPRYWPNNTPFVDQAGLITVTNGQTRSAVDFAPPSTGGSSSFLVYRVSGPSEDVRHCIDYVRADLDGAVVQRAHSDQQNGPRYSGRLAHGDYKIRIWDCADEGFDDVWYPRSPSYEGGETLTLRPGVFEVDTPVPIDVLPNPAHICDGRRATIVGTEGDDTIFGTDGPDVIVGLSGNDLVRARAGNDIVCGGAGRDRLFGGHGRDRVFGGNRNDVVKGDGGIDVLFGGSGNDRVIGGGGADTLFGGAGVRDRLDGRAGPDTCHDPGPDTVETGCES